MSPRTLRRWAENDAFLDELKNQHALARKFEQDELALAAKIHRDYQNLCFAQLTQLLNDPNTPPAMRIQCIRIGLQDAQAEARRTDAQQWREFVYFDKKKERHEKESRKPLRSPGVPPGVLPDTAEPAAKSGQSPRGPDVPSGPKQDTPTVSPKADKTGHAPMKKSAPGVASVLAKLSNRQPLVQPVKPFRHPPVEKKADKSGQAS